MDPIRRVVQYYVSADLRRPFQRCLEMMGSDFRAFARVRLRRIEEQGNYGDCEPVGGGVFELRIHKGPGYRVYFGVDGDKVIVLYGGDKGSQVSDIRRARDYWSDYNA